MKLVVDGKSGDVKNEGSKNNANRMEIRIAGRRDRNLAKNNMRRG